MIGPSWSRLLPSPLLRVLAGAVGLGVIVLGFQLLRPRPLPPADPPPVPAQTTAAPPPPAPAPAATTPPRHAPAPVTTAPAPTLPGLSRGGGTPPGDPAAVERMVAQRSPAELAFGGQLARAGVEAPAQLDELFRRRQRGDSLPELRRFVTDRFPRDLKLRAITLDWLERHPGP